MTSSRVLVKEIPDGLVSPALRRCRPGRQRGGGRPARRLHARGGNPRAAAVPLLRHGHRCLAVSLLRAERPGLDYRLLHGVRTREDLPETGSFFPDRYVPCVSRGAAGADGFPGRLTALLKERTVDPSTYCYLCGNSDMIYEVYGILKEQGVSREHIFAEVYF